MINLQKKSADLSIYCLLRKSPAICQGHLIGKQGEKTPEKQVRVNAEITSGK